MSAYHDILGVRPEASQEEIKAAFRKRALETHPDRAAADDKDAAQEEFVRVREAFEILCDEEDRRAPREAGPKTAPDADGPPRTRGPRQSYKERWRNAKKVRVSKDLVDRVGGQSSEYRHVRQRTRQAVSLGALAGVGVFLFDPLLMHSTGIFLVDFVLCGLVGSVYGFALGSIWAYVDIFLGLPGA
jgi:hypothetical protein